MNKKIKIQIKNRWTGSVIFEYEKEDNTVKDTVEEAVKSDANLGDANLGGANLRGANLGGANLVGAYLVGAYLGGADMVGANLGGANLRGANLRGAYLGDANLGGANLRCANLRGANLVDANLRCANLRGANLRDANLRGAYLGGADMVGANLGGANLRGANLRDANLRCARNIPYIQLACPSDGAFVGWKKVNGLLVKLQIPEDAKRSSATTNKCRCDKALVLEITSLDGVEQFQETVNYNYDQAVKYTVGKMVLPDSFDDNRWNECSHGIHFFINKQDAIDY